MEYASRVSIVSTPNKTRAYSSDEWRRCKHRKFIL